MSQSNMDNFLINQNESVLGVDIGSTTLKIVFVDKGKVIFSSYLRHKSFVVDAVKDELFKLKERIGKKTFFVAFSGSAGLGLAEAIGAPFVQEVYAASKTVRLLDGDADCAIELGGEDAKIIFFDKTGVDERMNGACAGGTGAFVEQMATLMNVSVEQMDALSLNGTQIYPIASRCGVFAKTDIQPLLNQGAKKEDVAASIFQSVVNQTIAGLSRGRKIKGKVVLLGGPMYYCVGLRKRFEASLTDANTVCPDYALYSVALGAALSAEKYNFLTNAQQLFELVNNAVLRQNSVFLPPLFDCKEDYDCFKERHAKAVVPFLSLKDYKGNAYLGIDCGSTTTKLVLISQDEKILYSYYGANEGDPVEVVHRELLNMRNSLNDDTVVFASAVTGYGEELIKNGFGVDFGVVETMAHYTAAKHFDPNVDFILDIGGQDIKCFKIRDGAIEDIFLNEACSSGCGSFLETFAKALDFSAEEFFKIALFAQKPVDLGTRCTVFMNSSVKQAQKDGATKGDISAGLSMSVVRNALYKVIRLKSAQQLGKNIIVQGGTFLNDAVLRCFEKEIGGNVVRPLIAGLMGAFGAALCAKNRAKCLGGLLSKKELLGFEHQSKPSVCNRCTNNCHLTINTFAFGKRFVSGNKCQKGEGRETDNSEELPNLYRFKRRLILKLFEKKPSKRNLTIGLPLCLGMYQNLPFFKAYFEQLGCTVVVSGFTTKQMYVLGQYTIPSDTVCYPAKISHGHIVKLADSNVDAVFFASFTYNKDEKLGDNHYNCPIVAYYGELLNANLDELKNTEFWFPYLCADNKKEFKRELFAFFKSRIKGLSKKESNMAVEFATKRQNEYDSAIKAEGLRALDFAQKNNKRVIVLTGQPYHIDPEVCHNLDVLANELGFVVLSEDALPIVTKKQPVNVLNQWTFHSRMYNAAFFAAEQDNCDIVQLTSFGCGINAITADEIKDILAKKGKLFTQIKIDEITNLGAVKIRLRSLLAALEERKVTNETKKL